jgi:methionyl-tRNA formyltransferase
MHMMTRVVFMGSPEFAVPSLRALTREYKVVGVVTQPGRPAGRGRALKTPAIKLEASALGLATIQPNQLSEPSTIQRIRDWAPEVIVVVAFGQLLRREMLDLPAHGCINVHASLLPRWRGAAPIQAAIVAGDAESGVTIMRMDEGLDTGPMIAQSRVAIDPQDTGGSLADKLAHLGAEMLPTALGGYLSGSLVPQPQDAAQATKAPLLKKEDGRLDPSQPAEVLERRVRAFNPWPGAFISLDEGNLKVHRAHVVRAEHASGLRLALDGKPALGTTDGSLVLDEVQPAGKRPMRGEDFLLGARGWQQDARSS